MAYSEPQSVGNHAESLALHFLRNNGMHFICRNYRCRFGEIDLIMRDRDCLVFVEVRYRKSTSFVSAAQSVTLWKQHKLIRAAQFFVTCNAAYADDVMRFDIVGIDETTSGSQSLQWLADAFRLN